jgi:hypothetical protein
MANRIQLRRDGAQQWANVNPTLAQGELGIEIDTGRIKIGDGVTSWNQLKYERPIEAETNTANTLVKRDADGGFAAGAITATLIGNASTATRLANARQISLAGDLVGAATFDGSSNLSLVAQLSFVPALPHYDPLNENATGTYTKVTVDSQGRVKGASTPNSLAGYGITDAQPLDVDLTAFASLTTPGIVTRASEGNIVTRSISVSDTGRLTIVNGNAVAGNPILDLAETGVAAASPVYFGSGATQKLFNVPGIAGATQTVYSTRIGVDIWGRIYSITDFPIATAVEGTTASAWATTTSYSRYDKVTNAGKLYQALNAGTSGAAAPTHTSGDASDGTVGWRYLGTVSSRQKGLASFDQEDFDVDANGHVVIASAGVDNTQLQNNQIRFADGNSYTAYELDNELTASTGYRGITTINDLSVNNTSGSPLLKCLAADDNVDINTTTATIFSDITLDKTSTSIQTINRPGSLTILMDANTASNRFLRLTANNAGTGEAKIEITADEQVYLSSTNSDVRVENIYFADNVISSTNSTIVIDPAGVGDDTGTLQIKGNLQVDGTTTTVNSTTISIDDVILTLGGDTAPTTDDNKDRGVEFRYYDTQARLGFYGWDDSYTTLAGTTGGYRFLYDATNTSEVFSGTDAGVIAGNLALSSNVGSTSISTGTLVVTGGTGISQNLNVGGTLTLTGAATLNNNVTIVGSNTAATEYFRIQNGSAATKFQVDTSSGNTSITGTLAVTDATTLTGNLTTQSASTVNIQNTTNTNVAGAIAGTAYASLGTYGALKIDGGASIANGLVVGGNLKIYGQFDVDGAVSYSGNTVFKGSISVDNDGISPFKFNVASNTGNVDTAGIITVSNTTDATTTSNASIVTSGGIGIAKQLRVGQGATIAGVTTITNATDSTALGTGALVVSAGGASINNQLRVGGNSTLTGTLGVTGATTLSSTLGVSGIATISNTTDSSATNTGALVVSGGAGIASQLRVGGATTLSSTLGVTGVTTLSGNLIANANSTLGDASTDSLTVNATSTFNAPVTISGSNNLAVGGNITVTGNLTVNGTTTTVNSVTMTIDDKNIELGSVASPTNATADGGGLTLRGATDKTIIWDSTNTNWTSSEHWNTASGKDYKVNNTSVINSSRALVNITGLTMPGAYDITVNTNKFIVSGATGNTTIAGTLGVTGNTTFTGTTGHTGASTFSSTVGITGDLSVNSNKFVVTASNGNTAIAGTLGVSAATTLSSTLGVAGIASITNSTSRPIPSGNSLPALEGALQVTGGAHIGENFVVNGDLKVYGAAVYQGGIDYQGTQTYSGIIKQNNSTDAASATDQTSSIYTAGGVAITKKLFVGSNTSVGGTLAVTGATTLSSTLGVTGITTLSGNLIANGNTTLGNASSDTLTVTATSTFNGAVSLTNTLSTSSSVTLNAGSLTIKNSSAADIFVFNPATASASITGTLGVSSNATVGGTFGVTGTTTLSSTLSVTGSTTLIGSLAANGGISVDGTAFTVADTTGNTSIAGTLSVTGNTTLTGSLAANGGISVDGTAFTVADTTGNVTTSGTLSVTGTSTFTGAITANGGVVGALTGNASTATTLQTSRTFNISGDATGTAQNFNGSANVVIPIILANSGVTAGTYTKITVDAKGRATIGASASTTDISEGTNLYYTQARFDTAFGGKTTTNLTEGTNLYYTQARFDTAFSGKSTTNLTEGTNLYFTEERAQDAAAAALVTNASHSGVTVTYNDAGNAINISRNELTYSNVPANGDGSKTAFLANSGRSVDNLLVIVDGLISTPTVDYTYADETVLSGVSGHRGENTVTVSSSTGLVVGQPVSGAGIAANATITNISGTTITLSANNLTYLRRAEISTIGTPVGVAVVGAANQTYTGVASTTNGSGTGATFNVTRGGSGQITGVTVNNGGTNYAVGNTITISGLLVGGSSSAENITFTVASVNSTTTTATFSPVVKFNTAPAGGTNNVSIRYLPL